MKLGYNLVVFRLIILLLTYFTFIFVVPGCVLILVFSLLLKGEKKVIFLVLSLLGWALCFIAIFFDVLNNPFATVFAMLALDYTIPVMCVTIVTYRKQRIKENSTEVIENKKGS